MLREFKEFAIKGNLVDTAVAFVMGMAFAKITSTFVDGIVMPVISTIIQTDLASWKSVLKPAVMDDKGVVTTPEVAIRYGDFVAAIIYFLIVAFVMFLIIKGIAATKKKSEEAAPPPAPPASEVLLGEIRDLLKK